MRLDHSPANGAPTPHVGPYQYQCPNDVLNDANLTAVEKREILAAWSSDRYAVPSKPSLRDVPGLPNLVPLHDILAALRKLDDDHPPRGGAAARAPVYRFEASVRADASNAVKSSLELKTALIAAHQRNIDRYCRLLAGSLSEIERAYVHKRIAEECKELERICRGQTDAGPSISPGKASRRRGRL